MKWTDEIPKVPGLYYWRGKVKAPSHLGALAEQWLGQSQYSRPIVLELVSHTTCFNCNQQQLMERQEGGSIGMRAHGQWAGPLELPEEP